MITNNSKYRNAKEIKKALDDYVLGQEQGTQMIAMAIAQHIQQIDHRKYFNSHYSQTDNILVVGPTGCGKTEMIRRLQSLELQFGFPIVMINTLDFAPTQSWQGTCITTIFSQIIEKAGVIYDATNDGKACVAEQKESIIEIANNAVIILDEFDKISIKGEGKSRTFLEEYQSNLLKIIEGNSYKAGSFERVKTNFDGTEEEEMTIDDVFVDTTHMMFIMIGAFDGLETITRYRLQKKEPSPYYQDTHIGFVTDPKTTEKPKAEEFTYEQLIPSQEDIINYGIMRELVGRIPIRTVFKPLSEDALINIMLNSKTSAYRQWQGRFEENGFRLYCDRSALREIARIAEQRATGARGLMTIFSELLVQTQYELSGDDRHIHCLLRGKEIRDGKPPLLHDRTPHLQKIIEQTKKKFLKKQNL